MYTHSADGSTVLAVIRPVPWITRGRDRILGCPGRDAAGDGFAHDLVRGGQIAKWRNRIETTFADTADRREIARHGAHTLELGERLCPASALSG